MTIARNRQDLSLVMMVPVRCCSRETHQRLTHANLLSLLDIVQQRESIRREQENRGSVLEPADLLTFVEASVADHYLFGIQGQIHKPQADTGYQHGINRNQRDNMLAA